MVLEGLRLLSWTICGLWTLREFWRQEGLMPYCRWTPPNQALALSTRFLVPWDQTQVLTTFICVMGVVADCSKEPATGQQEEGSSWPWAGGNEDSVKIPLEARLGAHRGTSCPHLACRLMSTLPLAAPAQWAMDRP